MFRLAVAAVDSAFIELQSCQPRLLGSVPEKKVIRGNREKIIDVIYTLHPSQEFIAEVKAASKRKSIITEIVNHPKK